MKVISSITKVALPAEPVTVTEKSKDLVCFNVVGGVPMGSAFDHLTVLMSAGVDAVEAIAINEDCGEPTATYSAVHTLRLAYALVQSMHQGYIEHRKQIEG